MKVNNDIRKAYHTCIYNAHRSLSNENCQLDVNYWSNKLVETFMEHHLNIDDTIIDEKKNLWYNPSLRISMRYYFKIYCVFLQSAQIRGLQRIQGYIRHSYDNLSPLDVNIFDIFLILCSNPFIISNILTEDLLKLLPNFGTVTIRFLSCFKLVGLHQKFLPHEGSLRTEQIAQDFIEELYN